MKANMGRMASVITILVTTTSRISPGLLFRACADTPSSRAHKPISFRLHARHLSHRRHPRQPQKHASHHILISLVANIACLITTVKTWHLRRQTGKAIAVQHMHNHALYKALHSPRQDRHGSVVAPSQTQHRSGGCGVGCCSAASASASHGGRLTRDRRRDQPGRPWPAS